MYVDSAYFIYISLLIIYTHETNEHYDFKFLLHEYWHTCFSYLLLSRIAANISSLLTKHYAVVLKIAGILSPTVFVGKRERQRVMQSPGSHTVVHKGFLVYIEGFTSGSWGCREPCTASAKLLNMERDSK